YVSEEGMVWNTQFHITFKGPSTLKDSILSVLEEVGHNLSVFDSTSLVSKVNRRNSTVVNRDFIAVYNMSKKINQLTDGMFDPTLSPLITAWGFGPGHKISSDTLKVDSILKFVGLNKTSLNDSVLIKENRKIEFNFSAIAKGYGCDRVAEMFKRNGVTDFLIEIGGEIVASGISPHNSNWNISIDRPVISSSEIIHDSQVIISFTDMGLATSGNYRNYHESGSSRYGHTISPVTGRPIQTDVLSATVLAPSSMEADALSTSFMALGSKKASELTLRLKLPVMLILSDSVWFSPEFEKLIVKQD
ncbi:MAG: FAD:protein FMN transferase, partial [Muribaculaceae bacterium]|nr:FAD:protein FMN transferase [Muribaculaceae bacterium]